jgi:subtilisin-like proprotein convertase family protein
MKAQRFPIFLSIFLFALLFAIAQSESAEKQIKDSRSAEPGLSVVPLQYADISAHPNSPTTVMTPQGQALIKEIEPNNTPATAQPIVGSAAVILGNNHPDADLDYYSFTGTAGDRVYAATMTSFSSSLSPDTAIDIYGTDGVTLLESDHQDGSLGINSSSIAGTVLPSSGTFYIRVRHFQALQNRPYHLHFRLQSGSPTAEVEPNDDVGDAQPLPQSGWISGSTSGTTDVDFYLLVLNAGDTVYASLDADPTRDNTFWNAQLGIGAFGGLVLTVNDPSNGSPGNPPSEAHFMTVKDTATYLIQVTVPSTTFGDYHLSVTVHPAAPQNCTTYTSSNEPQMIPTGPGQVVSTLTIPGNPRIGDLDVSINLMHTNMPDIDVTLISPAGNENVIFTDIGSAAHQIMNLIWDDQAAVPPVFTVKEGMRHTPEFSYRLSWFDGEDAGGTWTLVIRDDQVNNGGTLFGWSLTVCEPTPPPTCPPGSVQATVYSTDFEANDGGFTHSGMLDEWEYGLPTFAPVTGCNSGSSCWKTDLDNTYDNSCSQDLLSPNIDLTPYTGAAWITWAQKYQFENATFDHGWIEVREVGPSNPTRPWEFLDATMTDTVGNPSTDIQESSGWSVFTADISNYLGTNVEVNFHVDSDNSIQRAGLAIDDVSVYACMPCPTITVLPSTLPDGQLDVPYNQTVTGSGGTGPYIFNITSGALPVGLTLDPNTGNITGTPIIGETANFTITAIDTAGGCTGSQNYTVNIICPVITVIPSTLPNGSVGVLYDQTVSGSGGTGPYTFAVTSGSLPTGVILDPATGKISGIPTVPFTFNFTIMAVDARFCAGSQAYSITIDCPSITISPSTLPNGDVDLPYDQTVTASGGTAPYVYTLTSGALPDGLSLNFGTGQIIGTPTTEGTFNFTITATDSITCTGSQSYTVNIGCPTITLSPSTLSDGTVGTAYDQTVTATGGADPYVYSVSAGTLPTGLTLNPATGQISGTPAVSGTFNFTITATDSKACSGSQAYSVNISCAPITLSPSTLSDGTVGTTYDQTVTATGGTAPYLYSVSSGALPDGLNLDSATGQISGTPTTEGAFNFTITATDANTCTGSQSYVVNIALSCLFCDEFDDSSVDPNWTYIKNISDWSENGAALIGNASKKTQAYALPIFSAGCTMCKAETIMSTAGGEIWFLFHVQDKDNLVELLMKEQNDKWVLKHHINKKVVAKKKFISIIDPNTDYTVSIRYDGANFIATINGTDVITLAPGGVVVGGSIGFKVKGTTGTFQRIEVN